MKTRTRKVKTRGRKVKTRGLVDRFWSGYGWAFLGFVVFAVVAGVFGDAGGDTWYGRTLLVILLLWLVVLVVPLAGVLLWISTVGIGRVGWTYGRVPGVVAGVALIWGSYLFATAQTVWSDTAWPWVGIGLMTAGFGWFVGRTVQLGFWKISAEQNIYALVCMTLGTVFLVFLIMGLRDGDSPGGGAGLGIATGGPVVAGLLAAGISKVYRRVRPAAVQ